MVRLYLILGLLEPLPLNADKNFDVNPCTPKS